MATRSSGGAGRARAKTTPTKRAAKAAPAAPDPGDHEHPAGHVHAPGHVHGAAEGFDAACPECVIAAGGGHHHDWEHFPSDAELEAAGTLVLAPTASELARLTTTRLFEPSDGFDVRMPQPAPPTATRLIDRDLRDLILRPLPSCATSCSDLRSPAD